MSGNRNRSDSNMDHKSQVAHILLHEYRPDGYSVYKQWQIYLQISSTTSVRLDMVPGYCTNDGHRGKVEITSASYRPTPAGAALRFRVLKPTTVRAIAVLINKKKHSPYKLTDAWESERFWIYTILCDIEALGLIKRGSATEGDEEIQASKDRHLI